jgi:hypothetical protein
MKRSLVSNYITRRVLRIKIYENFKDNAHYWIINVIIKCEIPQITTTGSDD